MMTLFKLTQDEVFRRSVEEKLRKESGKIEYCLPKKFPIVYRYRAFSDYAIDDIILGKISLTSIGEYNDPFEGAIHRKQEQKERMEKCEQQWNELEKAGIGEFFSHEEFVKKEKERCSRKKHLDFDLSSYLGVKSCCFSENNDSTLMWAHYADENKGLCIEYDFNQLKKDSWLRKYIFPVLYTDTPMDFSDQTDDYSLDRAVLCSCLDKAKVWEYEKEWRLLDLRLLDSGEYKKRDSLKAGIKPSAVYFGYHFLRRFFVNGDKKREEETLRIKAELNRLNKLLDFIEENKIPIFFMMPDMESFHLVSCGMSVQEFRKFIQEHFRFQPPERYHHTVQKYLIEILEEHNHD